MQGFKEIDEFLDKLLYENKSDLNDIYNVLNSMEQEIIHSDILKEENIDEDFLTKVFKISDETDLLKLL